MSESDDKTPDTGPQDPRAGHGPDLWPQPEGDNVCPMMRCKCIEHRCKFWRHVTGKDPQKGEVDVWDCVMAWEPRISMEQAQRTYQLGADMETLRNVFVRFALEALEARDPEKARKIAADLSVKDIIRAVKGPH